ncbi:hypothetical protein AAZX31_20G031200 [Glycine max]
MMSSSNSQNPAAAAAASSEAQGSSSDTLSVDPALTLSVARNSGGSAILRAAFDRYRGIVFKNIPGVVLKAPSFLSFCFAATTTVLPISGHQQVRCGAVQSVTLSSSSEEALDGIIGFGQSNFSMLSQLSASRKVKKVFSHCLDNIRGGGIFAIGEVVELKVSNSVGTKIFALEKKTAKLRGIEKALVARHEAGHAVVGTAVANILAGQPRVEVNHGKCSIFRHLNISMPLQICR